MKKFLVGTSALVSAGLIAGSALAAGPNVSVGGFQDFQAGWADQDSAFQTAPYDRDFHTRSDTEVHVNVTGKADNGLGYGAVIELESDVTPADDGQGFNADKTYIFLESGLGRIELGSNTDAARALQVTAADFARATGGVDGDWYHFVNTTGGAFAPGTTFITTPELPTAHALGVTEDANKFTYYSPRYSGFQFGVSYTPDQGEVGSAVGFSGATTGDYGDVFNLGLNYTGQYKNVGVTAAVVGEFGDAELATTEDLGAWGVGLNLAYKNFTVGGSYMDWQESTLATGTTSDASVWTVGAAYETGPYGISVTYLDSEIANNELQNISVGADYKLAPGLVPYVEANFFELQEAGVGAPENDGTAILFGTQLNF